MEQYGIDTQTIHNWDDVKHALKDDQFNDIKKRIINKLYSTKPTPKRLDVTEIKEQSVVDTKKSDIKNDQELLLPVFKHTADNNEHTKLINPESEEVKQHEETSVAQEINITIVKGIDDHHEIKTHDTSSKKPKHKHDKSESKSKSKHKSRKTESTKSHGSTSSPKSGKHFNPLF